MIRRAPSAAIRLHQHAQIQAFYNLDHVARQVAFGQPVLHPEQLCLSFAELTDDTIVYEYAILVTSLTNEIPTIAQLYRDRANVENPFDELNNYLDWGCFTTQDIKR